MISISAMSLSLVGIWWILIFLGDKGLAVEVFLRFSATIGCVYVFVYGRLEYGMIQGGMVWYGIVDEWGGRQRGQGMNYQ